MAGNGSYYDEVFDGGGAPRAHAAALAAALEALGHDGLVEAGRRRDSIFMRQGITFEVGGADGDGPVDRPFPLDLVPRILPVDEWRTIKRGLAQRIRALNRFVDDVYHGREIVHDGVVPWPLVVSRPEFARAAHGIRPPGGVYCHVSGCDLVRDADGSWKVLEDNVRTPSGISYMLENRRAMTRLLPGLFSSYRVRPVDHYPMLLLNALREVAPAGDGEPTVVVWTPGPLNSAYFEHAFLARQMGVELVEASDLVVRDELCFIRTTNGLERVHAVYRRLDDQFIDPLEFRPDSLLGVPGLMRAYRAGTVAIVNAVGTGVADDKAIYHYVPEMIRYYLAEEPILDNVRTYMLDDPEQREHVLARLSELVVKPTSESGGKGVFIGPTATEAELERQRRLIEASPARWIAQELVQLSTCPTAMEDGRLAPRHVDLRPFAVFGDDIHIVPGGLTRVALREGSMIVNSSQGGGSKDTWVLEEEAPPAEAGARRPTTRGRRRRCPTCCGTAAGPPSSSTAAAVQTMLARIAHELYWIGRSLARAEHTARMLDGLFHEDVQGRRADSAGRAPHVGLDARDHGPRPRRHLDRPRRGRAPAHARPRQPRLGRLLRRPGARGRADRARRLLGRDVGGDQHDAARARLRRLRRVPHRPVLGLRLHPRALRAVLGRHRPHDAARRGLRVPAGGRADRGGRHDAADAAGRAPGRRVAAARGRRGARAAAGGRRAAGLPAPGAAAAQRAAGHALPPLRARVPGLGRGVGRHAARAR